jgi:hypothetical protein
MKNGRADVHASIIQSKERSDWLDFTPPYLEAPAYLYYWFKDRSNVTLTDFASARVGTQAPIAPAIFSKLFPQATQAVFENIPQMIDAIEQSQLDAIIADRPSSDFALLHLGMREDFIALDKPLFQISLRAAVAKGNQQLLETVNQVLGEITRTEMNAIFARWIDHSARLAIVLPMQSLLNLSRRESQWLSICEKCGSEAKIIASIEDQAVIDKMLHHFLENPPELLPAARASPESSWFA